MTDALDSFAPDVDLTADPPVEDVAETPEAPVVEEVKEEPKAEEPNADVKEEQKHQKMVPAENVAAVKAQAREWRLKAEQLERESSAKFAKLEQRLQLLANPPAPVPKFEEDPAGHLQHEITATKAELATLRQSSEETRQQHEAIEFERQIATSTQAAEQAFSKEHPDYLQAVQHLQTIADKNLQMMGVEDPAARQAQIRQDALAMSLKALQMGKSPAEVAFQLAVNYGYKAAGTTPQGEAAKKIAVLQEGQKAAVSIPSGGTKQSGLTLAELEAMDDDEFNKIVDDPVAWAKVVRQMQ